MFVFYFAINDTGSWFLTYPFERVGENLLRDTRYINGLQKIGSLFRYNIVTFDSGCDAVYNIIVISAIIVSRYYRNNSIYPYSNNNNNDNNNGIRYYIILSMNWICCSEISRTFTSESLLSTDANTSFLISINVLCEYARLCQSKYRNELSARRFKHRLTNAPNVQTKSNSPRFLKTMFRLNVQLLHVHPIAVWL